LLHDFFTRFSPSIRLNFLENFRNQF
jgi:hypothetical protein